MHQRATSIKDIAQATVHTEALEPDDPFFTDFSGLRGRFKEYVLYRTLGVDPTDFSFDYADSKSNKLVFLAGMRGAGKSTELRRYMRELENSGGFFCVFCSIDTELDSPYLEYVEILIYQMEKLIDKLQERGVVFDKDSIKSLTDWFQARIQELNAVLGEGTINIEVENSVDWLKLRKLLQWIRTIVFSGSLEQAGKIRMTFNNRFPDFLNLFNAFVKQAGIDLRKRGIARDILFIIDGLEKTQTTAARRRIIIEEGNRISQIRANMLFTLPIDMMQDIRKIRESAEVITFPFVKVREMDGEPVEPAIERFKEFVYHRIAPELFENEDIVRDAILFSGGSPRELLRLLQHTSYQVEPQKMQLNRQALLQGVEYLSADARLLSVSELDILKTIKKNNELGVPTPYMDGMQRLLENVTIMEYNDGTYKRVNPIIEHSPTYRHYVG